MNSISNLIITVSDSLPTALIINGGFFGAKLSRRLLRENIKVIFFDKSILLIKNKFTDLLENKNFCFYEHNINKSLPKIEKLKYVFYFSKSDKNKKYKDINTDILSLNSSDTRNALEAALKSRAKFLFISFDDSYLSNILPIRVFSETDGQKMDPSHYNNQQFTEALVIEYYNQYKLNCRIAYLADIYGPETDPNADIPISKLIKGAARGEKTVVEHDKSDEIFPIFIDDAIDSLMRILFLAHTNGKIYNLFGEKTTFYEIIQILGKITGKESEVEFKKATKEENKILLSGDFKKIQEELGWKPKVSLEERLRETLYYLKDDKVHIAGESFEESEPKGKFFFTQKPIVNKEWKFSLHFNYKIILILLILIIIISPLSTFIWEVFWGKENLSRLEKESLAPVKMQKIAATAENHFSEARTEVNNWGWLFKLAKQEGRQREWMNRLVSAEKISEGIKEIATAGVILEKVGTNVLSSNGDKVKTEEIIQGKISLMAAQEAFSEAEANLKANSTAEGESQVKRLSYYQNILKEGDSLLDILPDLIATDGKKTYLLLFQNNMEIRPTGGFIGSFGLLTFENSKFNFKIEDIYTADGQLRGHVEPPEAMKKYLGKEHWYLRDSNWNPDFPKSAEKAQWFLEKELGVTTDGVFALDLNFAKSLLEIFGSVQLQDYNEAIDSNNLFEKTQRYVETDFFPGSTQKQNFLSSLGNALLEKIINNDGKWFTLGKTLNQSLEEKHLALYFSDPKVERKIIQNGWGGEIKEVPCQNTPDCYGDYLLTVEANLGVNKVNNWVSKKINDQINIGNNGDLHHQLILNFQNSSPPDAWNGGLYKDYVRIFVPEKSVIEEFRIDGVATESAKIASASGKTTLEFYLEVPPQQNKEVTVTYRSGKTLPDKNFRFDLLVQKQAGIQNETISIEVFYPLSWRIDKVEALSLTKPGHLEYNDVLRADKDFKIIFIK